MTDIAFHFGAPDRLLYACRLLRKASGTGTRVLVVGDGATLEQLDRGLWDVAATDFITHCGKDADRSVANRSSVVLVDSAKGLHGGFSVLLNLGERLPDGFGDFGRVIEVVSQDDSDRQSARQRWKDYTAMGYNITRHDVGSRATV